MSGEAGCKQGGGAVGVNRTCLGRGRQQAHRDCSTPEKEASRVRQLDDEGFRLRSSVA